MSYSTIKAAEQQRIDISNLRFYARMAKEFRWSTDVIHFGVIAHTLNAIAEHISALSAPKAPVGQPVDKIRARHMFKEDEWIEQKAAEEDGANVYVLKCESPAPAPLDLEATAREIDAYYMGLPAENETLEDMREGAVVKTVAAILARHLSSGEAR
jgi:uncharacterized protein (DUF2267 family)